MNLSRLRLITFDVTDTLLKFRSTPAKQYGEIGAMYGVLCDNFAMNNNFKKHWHGMNKEHPNFGLHSGLGWENWWKRVIIGTFRDSKVPVDDAKLDKIAGHLIDTYKTSACWQQAYGTLGILSYLRSKGYPMGIISNFDPRLEATLENTKLRHYFNFVLVSYEVGFVKPDGRIYDEALRMANLPNLKPEECLHIGDTPILDYVGAKNAGWNAALIHEAEPEQLVLKYPDLESKHVFRSLYELHKHLLDSNASELEVVMGSI